VESGDCTYRVVSMTKGKCQLVQVNVPDYKVSVPQTGEIGALSSIVNTHWNLLYWEPMKKYFQKAEVNPI